MSKGGKRDHGGRSPGQVDTPAPTLVLQPADFIRAWSADAERLRVSVSGTPPVGGRAAVKIRLAGMKIQAAITGVIRSIWREAGRSGVELAPDAPGLRAARWLAAAARGEQVSAQERARRHLVDLPVVVSSSGPGTFTTTLNVSEGGCALRWSGALPEVGEVIRLRLGANMRASEARFVVRWTDPARPGRVGLQLDADPMSSAAWGRLLSGGHHGRKPT